MGNEGGKRLVLNGLSGHLLQRIGQSHKTEFLYCVPLSYVKYLCTDYNSTSKGDRKKFEKRSFIASVEEWRDEYFTSQNVCQYSIFSFLSTIELIY